MSEGGAWRGNWHVRLHDRIRDRGYRSVTAFAEARPTATWVQLADELGTDVAAVQIQTVLIDEAKRSHKLPRLMRGMLVRELRQWIPNGWPPKLEDPHSFPVSAALGGWIADAPDPYEERARQASQALRANPPPPGWLPEGPDDELLLTLIPDEET